ncbi:TetR family transcriptional regulator [Gordonia sp. PDNC005]|uniref:TetR/AcrR family transcriptional regulator n=1 Tax=unclassified Gordonia (in: high G+C Gram-positive bacteria) TaxID=2657482 RepID=UPI0019635CE6|nr:TetR/AcrR family transcriptional regulator [Gordonia sp. PDNC005]QRY62840.1 TetR family transcriptional regulator [Gordonia sp. PDNC005]
MTKDSADRREGILKATLDIIKEAGIDRVRGADVAKRVGVSVGLVFYHFENLETLIVAALQYAASRDIEHRDAALAASSADVTERLDAMLREYGPSGSEFGWRLWVQAWSASLRDPTLRAVVHDLDAGWRDVLIEIIDDGVAQGVFTCPDPAGATWRLTAMLDGLAVQHVVFDDVVTVAQIREWTQLALTRELGI